jgi:hypothetical protein
VVQRGRLNNRTHRKLLIVDGRIGFTGGVGIADTWLGHAQDPDHWRDSHYRLDGPAVADMQAAFMDNWMETCGEVLHGEEYFPPLEPVGPQPAQVFRSSADDGSESVRLLYLISIASAERSVRLANSYFVPDSLAIRTLVEAQRRGATLEILVPGRHIDQKTVRRASRALWGPLLEAGVAIYEYQPTMYHAKVAVVDEIWTSVGSTNFDTRSFRLNDEANLNVFDTGFARVRPGCSTRTSSARGGSPWRNGAGGLAGTGDRAAGRAAASSVVKCVWNAHPRVIPFNRVNRGLPSVSYPNAFLTPVGFGLYSGVDATKTRSRPGCRMFPLPALPTPQSHRLDPTVYRPAPAQHLRVCPECAGPLVRASACVSCRHCGWGKCG